MIGPNARVSAGYNRAVALPKMPEVPLSEKIRTYRMGPLGHAMYEVTLGELRQQLRSAELKDEIFYAIQEQVLQLMGEPKSLDLDPIVRLRELAQGGMTAFHEKKMDQSEAARVIATSAVLFFPRGRVEQLDVAKFVACELTLTKINLGTEMVQVAFGCGKAFAMLIGLAALLPKVVNPQVEYLESIYKRFHDGVWMGTMIATNSSTVHGNANVAKFEEGFSAYSQELLQRAAASKAKSLLGGWFGK